MIDIQILFPLLTYTYPGNAITFYCRVSRVFAFFS